MTTATPASPSASGSQGQVMAEAAQRMLPVLASRLLAAVADRLEASIDQLADRLGELAENGGRRDRSGDAEPSEGGGLLSRVPQMALEQARAFLDLVVRLLAQAAAAARSTAERLRARRAPEGIDEAEEDVQRRNGRTPVAV